MDTPKVTKPSKQAVREYMDRRTHEVEPPPTPEEIRRELGWKFNKSNDSLDFDE